MGKEELIGVVIDSIGKLAENEKFRGMVLGTYSDGTARSIPDAITDEQLSPKTKAKIEKKAKKKAKKKKYAKFKLWYFGHKRIKNETDESIRHRFHFFYNMEDLSFPTNTVFNLSSSDKSVALFIKSI